MIIINENSLMKSVPLQSHLNFLFSIVWARFNNEQIVDIVTPYHT